MQERNILSFCEKVKNYLLIAFAFIFPISLAAANILLATSFICWLVEGRWREKVKVIKKNKLIWIIYAWPLLLAISTFFSSSITHGFFMNSGIKNEYQFIVQHFLWLNTIFLILITSKIDYKKLLSAFLFGMLFSEIVSYLIYFKIINWKALKSAGLLTKSVSPFDPSPFMHHTFYSLFLTIAILLIFDNLKNFRGIIKIFSMVFLVSATINLFINGGRTGQLALIFGVLVYAINKYKSYKAFFKAFFLLISIFIIAYNFSYIFKKRMNMGINGLENVYLHNNFESSWGKRIAGNIIFTKIVLNNPKIFVLGCGAGEAKEKFLEFAKAYDMKMYLAIKNFVHLHNQYFQLWCDGSILAVVLIILYFIYLYKYAPSPLTLSIIVVFAFSFIADVMLYRPKTYMLFLFISALLLKEYSSNDYETNNTAQDNV